LLIRQGSRVAGSLINVQNELGGKQSVKGIRAPLFSVLAVEVDKFCKFGDTSFYPFQEFSNIGGNAIDDAGAHLV
jgi:hypothetical protein